MHAAYNKRGERIQELEQQVSALNTQLAELDSRLADQASQSPTDSQVGKHMHLFCVLAPSCDVCTTTATL
jgi:uncharacterized coiled-coil protein SlyX